MLFNNCINLLHNLHLQLPQKLTPIVMLLFQRVLLFIHPRIIMPFIIRIKLCTFALHIPTTKLANPIINLPT